MLRLKRGCDQIYISIELSAVCMHFRKAHVHMATCTSYLSCTCFKSEIASSSRTKPFAGHARATRPGTRPSGLS